MRVLPLVLSMLLSWGAFALERGGVKTHQAVVDNLVQGAELYKVVFVQLKKLRKALKKAKIFQKVRFTLLENRIKNFNTEGALDILNEYRNRGGDEVDKFIRKIRRKILAFNNNLQNSVPAIVEGVGWTPTTSGVVGRPLVLEVVAGIQNGDIVTYSKVSGSCNFGSGNELGVRTLTFSGEGTCVVKAIVERVGHDPWDSGNISISVVPGILSNVDWMPTTSGVVGTPLLLDTVVGVQNGDAVTYLKVSGSCNFGSGNERAERTLSFEDEGNCVVKATVERSGYNLWDSGNKSIVVGLGTLTSVGWTPATTGRVGTPLLLDAVAGIQNGDSVAYIKESGNCSFGGGNEAARRTLTFDGEGTCVVRATVERSGYNSWNSGAKTITVGAMPIVGGVSWIPATGGTVGVPLLLDAVGGVQDGDTVSYVKVSGNCSFGSDGQAAGRTLTFVTEGTCVVKATVERHGYATWDSGNQPIAVELGTITSLGWTPTTSGKVGTPVTLEAVSGTQYSDIVIYRTVSGNCRFGSEKRELSLRTLSFSAAGTCVVKATVERMGYALWDSGDKSIVVSPAPSLIGIGWTPATSAAVGAPLILDAVVGTQSGDTVIYTKISGSCAFNDGGEVDRRTLRFVTEGTCVVKAIVERMGHTPWDSGNVSITVSGVATVSLPCGDSVPGGMRFFSTHKAFALLEQNGSVVTWGDPVYGGNSSGVPKNSLSGGVVQIFTTKSAFAALKGDGTVVTWGHADSGGDSSLVWGGTLNNGVKVCQIVGSDKAFAALKEDGSVVTWGSAVHGGNLSVMKFYYRVPGWEAFPLHSTLYNSGVRKVVATGSAFAAIKVDGTIFTWGNETKGGDGVMGYGTAWSYDIRPILRQGGFVDLYSNDHAFAAIKEETVNAQKVRYVVAWGYIDNGGKAPSAELTRGVNKIYSNGKAFAALMENGSVVAWGSRGNGGVLGSAAEELQSGVINIFSNNFTFVALKNNGSLVSWGELYDGGRDHLAAFPASSLESGVVKVVSNNYGFVALKDNGSVVAWGDRRGGGDLSGMGDTLDGGVVDLASTEDTFAAHKSDGSVVVWGSSYGALPHSIIDTTCLSSGVVWLAASTSKAYVAVKDDGTLVTWGDPLAGGHLYYGGNGEELEKCELSLEELDELL